MYIGTHTLLPVCIGMAIEQFTLSRGRGYVFPERGLVAIAVFGAMPDLCTPHLSLDARYSSWSHTLWFLVALMVVTPMIASFFRGPGTWRLALACWLAAALHLACDAIAGGIAWLKPWSDEILGSYIVPPSHWMWWDVAFLLLTWLLVRLRPLAEARGMTV